MIPVILSGGSGTRLWPVSRSAYPKQFCELLDESLLLKTYYRLSPLGLPRVLTTRALDILTQKSLGPVGLKRDEVFFEPQARNTAPAVAFLCRALELQGVDPSTVIGLFPADAYIEHDQKFVEIIREAQDAARSSGRIVTLGIQPTYPATGYGYIETLSEPWRTSANCRVLSAAGFREKPDAVTAQKFLETQRYFWNAGMFVFRLDRMIQEFARQMPEMWAQFSMLKPDLSNLDEIYSKVTSQSLDYGIMEGLKDILVIPADVGWSDVGSWDDFLDLPAATKRGSKSEKHVGPTAQVVNVESTGVEVFSRLDKVYSFIGLQDIELIDTTDATLVIKKGESQKVKKVIDELLQRKDTRASQHSFEVRPWGRFDVLANRPEFKSKVIEVDAGQQISYQSHNQRAEHWIIIEGIGEVVLNDEVIPVRNGSYVYIPLKAKHRIRNTGQTPLKFVEVQTGDYFGEDDIIRYQDDYQRN